jgi:thioredoxin
LQPEHFYETLRAAGGPVVVEFWAPWCGPCRMMAPALEQAARKYEGQVRLIKINADEARDLVQTLRVMAIPTVLVFDGDREVLRRTGAQTPAMLDTLFARLAEGGAAALQAAPPPAMDPTTRMIRLTSGLLLALLGVWLQNPLVLAAGGLVAFWGFYDRCPIWNALWPRVRKLVKN